MTENKKQKIYQQILTGIDQGRYGSLRTIFQCEKTGKVSGISQEICWEGDEEFSYTPQCEIRGDRWMVTEPMARDERLLVLGGGHISRALCSFAAKCGFLVWVADEREEFANPERFPEAERVICAPYEEVLKEMAITKRDYVAIVTRGHSCDGKCLYEILTHEMPYYLGMIGSRSRVKAQIAMFEKMGVDPERLQQVHNPIGLPIHAVTPEEIAVSITAELIQERRKEKREETVCTDLDGYMIQEIATCKKPAALATLIRAKGSCPRREGAKMLIYADGSIKGSTGGGLAEHKAIEIGRELIGTGQVRLFSVQMDASVAADDGMACGGSVDILLEDLEIHPRGIENPLKEGKEKK